LGPFPYDDSIVIKTLREWFETSGELFVELYKPRSGGSGSFYVLKSLDQYDELMVNANPGSFCFVLRDPQLPIRGIVDDGFIARSLSEIASDGYYVVIEPCTFPGDFNYLADGKTHAELKLDLEKLRGKEAWAGDDLNMPGDYSRENYADNALIAKKPD